MWSYSPVRLTIPRLSPRQNCQDCRFRESDMAMLSSTLNHKHEQSNGRAVRTISTETPPCKGLGAVMNTSPSDNDCLSHAAKRKNTRKICRRLVCFGGESKDAFCSRAEKKLQFAHY
jgi:hypothetical protein